MGWGGGWGGGSHCEAHDLQTWRPLGLGPKSPLLRRNIFQMGETAGQRGGGGGIPRLGNLEQKSLLHIQRERRSLPGPADSRR